MENKKIIIIVAVVCVVLLSAIALYYFYSSNKEPIVLNMVGVEGVGAHYDFDLKVLKMFEAENPGIKVNIVDIKTNAGGVTTDERQDYLVKHLSSGSSDIDVFMGDVVWTADFAANGWVMPLSSYMTDEERSKFLKGPMDSCMAADGKYYCIPVYTDGGVLYYRKDLLAQDNLAPPKTWNDLVNVSLELSSKNKNLTGIVFQADQYEGLMCNFLEYVWGNNGGIQDGAKFVVSTPQNEEALQFMTDMIHKYNMTPPNILTMQEESSREYFFKGNTIFLRNWPYVWGQLKLNPQLDGKVGVIPMVHNTGGESASTLGGWNIMVSKYTKNPEASIKLAKFLTSERIQKLRAVDISQPPTIDSLYQDSDVISANPFFPLMHDVLIHTHPRPILKGYREASGILQKYIYKALSNEMTPKEALNQAQIELDAFQGRTG